MSIASFLGKIWFEVIIAIPVFIKWTILMQGRKHM